MKSLRNAGVWILALVVATACASTQVSNRQAYTGGKIARPDRILVYDFAADASDVPGESSLAGQMSTPATPPTAEQLAEGHKLGVEVAKDLVAEIQKMGLPAVRAEGAPGPRPGELVLKGYFVSVDEGSAVKRIVVGFGSGGPTLKTMVEGFLMTENGLRRLGSGEIDSGSGKSPGLAVPLVVTLATANPIGLAVGGAVKAAGEISGASTIEGSGKRTAEEIAKELKIRFQQQGWIE